MATYKTGKLTQEKTLDCARTLFFEKGYRATPFGEICKKAGVNPGSISYHFKGKAHLARLIYTEMMASLQEEIEHYFSISNELLRLIVSIASHVRFMYANEAYRRFNTEFCSDCIPEIQNEQDGTYSALANDFLKKYLSPEKYEFFLIAVAGFDSSINTYICKHLDAPNIPATIHYACELYLYFIDDVEKQPLIEQAIELTESLHIQFNSSFQLTLSKFNLD